jgi:hypothetical protein
VSHDVMGAWDKTTPTTKLAQGLGFQLIRQFRNHFVARQLIAALPESAFDGHDDCTAKCSLMTQIGESAVARRSIIPTINSLLIMSS